jgi:Holliday junction resolvase
MRYAKVDANQTAVVSALRAAGASVQSLASVGKGVPDLLIGFRGVNLLMEVKDGNKAKSAQKLTEDQLKWHGQWLGPISIVDGPEAALRALGVICEIPTNE